MTKRIVVKIAGTGNEEPREIDIHPGTTTKDVLDALGVGRNMMLTKDPAGEPFASGENLWTLAEGQKVFCAPVMEVGRK